MTAEAECPCWLTPPDSWPCPLCGDSGVDSDGLEPENGADLSECGLYRYRLWRVWDAKLPLCTWIMLNPSTADASEDDPTIRKCIGFSKRWGQGGIQVVNLYAYRATDPKELKAAHARGVDVIGPENDEAIAGALRRLERFSGRVVVAWGGKCRSPRRGLMPDRAALGLMRAVMAESRPHDADRILCLKRGASGFPWHPLYMPYDTIPMPYGNAP